MKKLLRLGFSIGLGALCIGILTLVASLLSWIKLVDVYTMSLIHILSPIVYVPVSISTALHMSLVPSISASLKLRRFKECTINTGT